MHTKRMLVITLGVVLTLATFSIARQASTTDTTATTPVGPTYTAVRTISLYHSVGDTVPFRVIRQRLARRSDASGYEEMIDVDGQPPSEQTMVIIDLKHHRNVSTYAKVQARTTLHLTPKERQNLVNIHTNPSACTGDPGPMILGHATVAKSTYPKPGHGNVQTTSYYAPDLGCFMLKAVVVTLDGNNQPASQSVYETTDLQVGVFDNSKMQVPIGLQELSPGEVGKLEGWHTNYAENDTKYYATKAKYYEERAKEKKTTSTSTSTSTAASH